MNGHEAAKVCERIWRMLPPDDEDALIVLQLVVDRFVSIDETGHNRELFIKWLEHTRRHYPSRVMMPGYGEPGTRLATALRQREHPSRDPRGKGNRIEGFEDAEGRGREEIGAKVQATSKSLHLSLTQFSR